MSIDLRHAVIDGPDGTDMCEAPEDRDDAIRLRDQHKFWCATQAGGCGGALRLHAGEVVVPYFQHIADGVHCALQSGSRSSGDAYYHLAYQREIATWLEAQGYVARMEHTFEDGGGRADLHVTVEGVDHSIEVQLSRIPAETWTVRTARYARHVDKVTWLHGPQCEATLTTDRVKNGLALAVARPGGHTAIGVHWAEQNTDWAGLSECKMTPQGIWSPHSDEAAREVERLKEELAERKARERAERLEAERAARALAAERAAAAQRRLEREHDAARKRDEGGTAFYRSEVVAYPPPGMRTFEQWEHLFPEMGGWSASQSWGWLDGFDPLEQRAGRWMAFVVAQLYAKAMVDDLRHPELTDVQCEALTAALFATGLAELEAGNPFGRWVRAGYGS